MSRALRRHHRERVIAKRAAAADAVYGGRQRFVQPEGALADNQYWLGCNRAGCRCCHPHKHGWEPKLKPKERAQDV